jgi:hypothetical protein
MYLSCPAHFDNILHLHDNKIKVEKINDVLLNVLLFVFLFLLFSPDRLSLSVHWICSQ